MDNSPPSDICRLLDAYHQQHLLTWWDALNPAARGSLVAQIAAVDFKLIQQLHADALRVSTGDTPEDRARRAQQPRDLIRLPQTADEAAERIQAAQYGEQLLAFGKVGIILVAGGQGTRLGFDHPKGMFPIGPVSGNTLFQILIERAVARFLRARRRISYYVMTSDATHDETINFFEQHDYFGLDVEAVKFFRQGNMPAVDRVTGKLLLAGKGQLALSPDGHGGMLPALQKSGLLDDMRNRGVEYLFYHQVDNLTAAVCDPVFLGFHEMRGSEMSTKVVAKCSAGEKMGVVVDVDGETQIIEYSDLPKDVAAMTDDSGQLRHWAGSTAIHVFDRTFLERLTAGGVALPFHAASKVVSFVEQSGEQVEPDKPNALKFERFIFDALPHAHRALVVEADRATEFSPIKNASGADSPATARRDMSALFARWLVQAGTVFPDDVMIEISPLFALDANELQQKLKSGTEFNGPVHLQE
jgi:UDP-N-acetylglucosamine/UDP-N-acetylgalactosamine diphosphorylase